MTALALALLLAAPGSTEKAFSELVTKARLTFTRPAGFAEVPIEANRQMNYDLALRDPTKALEIRIAVRLPQPPAKQEGPKTTSVPDESVFPALVQATLLNLSAGGEVKPPKAFSARAVQSEFNADAGFTSFVEPKVPGWNGWKSCMMYALRKAGAGEVYVFFLFDDYAAVEKLVRDAFHVVKFK
jgi:hypothetical protein